MSLSSSPSSDESYARLGLGRRWRRARGFRLCAGKHRFSKRGLRAKLLTFLGLVGRHARQLGRRLSTTKLSTRYSSPCTWSSSARPLVGQRRLLPREQAAGAEEGGVVHADQLLLRAGHRRLPRVHQAQLRSVGRLRQPRRRRRRWEIGLIVAPSVMWTVETVGRNV